MAQPETVLEFAGVERHHLRAQKFSGSSYISKNLLGFPLARGWGWEEGIGWGSHTKMEVTRPFRCWIFKDWTVVSGWSLGIGLMGAHPWEQPGWMKARPQDEGNMPRRDYLGKLWVTYQAQQSPHPLECRHANINGNYSTSYWRNLWHLPTSVSTLGLKCNG